MARIIQFEGRTFNLPDDATDDEVAEVLNSTAPAAKTVAAAPAGRSMADQVKSAIFGDKVAGAPTAAAPAPVVSPDAAPAMAVTHDALGSPLMTGDVQPPLAQPAAPAGPAAPDRGALTEGLAVASQLPQGARTGLANMLGLPVDLVNAGLSFLGANVEKPFMGSKMIDEGLRAPATAVGAVQDATGMHVFGKPEAPTGPGGRMLHRVGEEIGAAALPAGAAVHAGKMGVEAARKLPALVAPFVEPAAINPSKFVAKEAAAAAAAGTGAGVANEATRGMGYREGSEGHNAGDIAGAFTGVGAMALSKAVTQPLMNVWGAVRGNPKYADSVIKDNVVDEIMRSSGAPNEKGIDTGPLVDTIMNGPKASQVIPGFKETLADRTGNPGIAATEFNRSGGQNGGAFKVRGAENTVAVDNAMSNTAPKGEAAALRAELELERTRRLSDADTHTSNAQGAVDEHGQRLQPGMTADGRGANVRASLEDAHGRVNADVERQWAPINNSDAPVDITPLADRFAATSGNLSEAERGAFRPRQADIPERLAGRGEQPAPEPTGVLGPDGQPIMREAAPVDPNVPLREVTGIRSVLTDRSRKAAGADQPNKARVTNQYVDDVNSFVDEAVPPALRDQYETARGATRDMKDRFARPQTAIAQTLDRQQGQPRVPNSDVTAKFVQHDEGNVADFHALMREAGDDPRVVPALRDQMLADVRDRRLLENPAELDAYIRRYNTVLSEPRFAAVREELGTAAGLRRSLDTATSNQAVTARELGTPGKDGTSTVGKYLKYGDERAQEAMTTVMKAPKPGEAADELLRFVNDDPKAVEGARKAFWDIMQKEARSGGEHTQSMAGVQPWQPNAMKKFLSKNSTVAERLYRDNPEHLENINKIAETLQHTNTGGRGKATGTSGTAQIQQSILPSMETLGSRAFAVERGVVGIPFTILNLAGIMARRATSGAQATAFHAAMDRALLDPDWAAMLLKENNPANRAAFAKSSKAYWGNEASTYTDLLNGSDERDPTKDAIMRGKKIGASSISNSH